MSFFRGSYLRILKPKTIDGVNLMYEPDGSIAYSESHQANTAVSRKIFEKQNLKLAHLPHLKLTIEVVNGDEETEVVPQAGPKPNEAAKKKPTPVAKSGGPKPNPAAKQTA